MSEQRLPRLENGSKLSMTFKMDLLMTMLIRSFMKTAAISSTSSPTMERQELTTITMRSTLLMEYQGHTRLRQVRQLQGDNTLPTSGTMDWAAGPKKNRDTITRLENLTITTQTTQVFATMNAAINMADARERIAMQLRQTLSSSEILESRF